MQCIIYSCKETQYRRNLCKYHHRCRQMLSLHCTKSGCIKPLFAGSLFCRRHYREEYAQCLIQNCPEKTFTTHFCRRHYQQYGKTVKVPQCLKCDSPVFVFGLCVRHNSEQKCSECNSISRAKGLCTRHYFKRRRKAEKESLVEAADDVFDNASDDEGGTDQYNQCWVHNNNRVNET